MRFTGGETDDLNRYSVVREVAKRGAEEHALVIRVRRDYERPVPRSEGARPRPE